jgi:hypothetical protein
MPGYILVEQSELSPPKANGIPAHQQALGFLDFLRELSSDECPFPKFAEVRLVGLEEVLHAARPDDAALALDIHRRLRQAAPSLERRLMSVQVVFKGKLMRGDALWVEYRSHRLPIAHIFGTLPRQSDGRGNVYYRANFNLTNG